MSVLDWPVIEIFGILTALTCIILAFFQWSYNYWAKRNVPYLRPRLPYGNLESPFKKDRLSPGIHLINLYKQARINGWKFCGLYFFTRPLLMILDLDLIKNVLSKDFNHFVDRGFYYNEKKDPLGAHLFAIGGTKWKNLRRKLTPTFTSGKMRSMFNTVDQCGKILESVIANKVDDGGPFDIKELLARFTTNVIGSCAFGLECNTFETENSPFRTYSKKLISLGPSLQMIALTFAMTFPNAGRVLGIRQISKDVADFFFGVVHDAIKYREENEVVRKDFLQLLLELKDDSQDGKGDGNTLTTNEIAAQCLLFFTAGFETSSSAMSFALYEMSKYPDVQKKVREEIKTVLAKYNGEITYDALAEMHYMDQIIDETLRLYPPLPVVMRVCVEDYKIPNEDTIIEKGTKVMIPIYGIHHDEDYFPNPKVFNPDRFSPENKSNILQYSHIPFGEGNRICIGLRFGIMQTKVGLTVLLRNYEFSLNPRTSVPMVFAQDSFILSAEGGIWLDCKKLEE